MHDYTIAAGIVQVLTIHCSQFVLQKTVEKNLITVYIRLRTIYFNFVLRGIFYEDKSI